jgi:hypothetical protein
VLVHWWYLPDSYDSILGLDEVGDPDLLDASESRPIGPWKVNGRFITDLEVFHEWMNEKDYEVTDDINGCFRLLLKVILISKLSFFLLVNHIYYFYILLVIFL